MTYVGKLMKKRIEEGATTFDDDGRESAYAHKGDCVLVDDLFLAFLEKNKEIQTVDKSTEFPFKVIYEQARAFRELVEFAEKEVKKE